jgi:hypothetical protein
MVQAKWVNPQAGTSFLWQKFVQGYALSETVNN